MEISDKVAKELKEAYEDCLELKRKGDLTKFGRGEFSVLEIIFEG